MVLAMIIKKVKSFFLLFVAIWKRILCCFGRRRKSSFFVPLTDVNIVSNENVKTDDGDYWGNWDEQLTSPSTKPSTIQEYIEVYRQQAIAARRVQEEELPSVQENFFEDMAPTITRQTKHYISNKGENGNYNINKLSLEPDSINIVSQELEEWDENEGWEDQTLDMDAREALKESRKQARQKKLWEQQQRKQEKSIRPVLGAKVFS